MPKLTDVLGAIMADIAEARRIADEQTISIAQRYRNDQYLRGMTVPRLRLPEIVMELPIVIERCDAEAASSSGQSAGSLGASGPGDERSTAAGSRGGSNQAQAAGAGRRPELMDKIVSLGSDVLRRVAASESDSGGTTGGGNQSEPNRTAPSLSVLVAADDIKNKGEGIAISRLRLTIREEGLEWSLDDDEGKRDGEDTSRLIPE